MSVFFKLRWYFRQQWRRYLAAVLALVVISLITMIPPWLTGQVIDAAAEGTLAAGELGRRIAAIVLIAVAAYGLRFVWRHLLFHCSAQLGVVLRSRIYAHLTRLPPRFFDDFPTGDLMARATNDIAAVEMTAAEGVLALVDGALTAIVVLILLAGVLNGPLTLVALLPWPFLGWYLWRVGRRLHEAFGDAQERFGTLNEMVQERLGAIRTVKAFGLASHSAAEFSQAARRAAAADYDVALTESRYEPAIGLAVGMSFLLTTGAGAWWIHQGAMSVGELTTFTLYLGYMIWPMFAVGWLLNIVERGDAAYARICRLLAVTPDDDGGQGCVTTMREPRLRIDIRRFAYPGRQEAVLRDIDLEIPAGTTWGIVGPTGAGKSTLVRLLVRLYAHPEARVFLDRRPLCDYAPDALLRWIVLVTQEPLLFSTTVAENIALGAVDTEVDEAALRRAAQIAAIDEEIRALPQGYQTPVGERGVMLSGGQRQRLALARALMREPPVLILDDALSAVDPKTEKVILHRVAGLRRGKTTIMVSHRLTAVGNADQIIVLRDGTVTEQGVHRELIRADGWYARACEFQRLVEPDPEG